MLNIKSLLGSFSSLQSSEFLVQKAVQEALQNVVQVTIDKKNVTFQNSVVFVQTHPTIKHAYTLKKEAVLTHIKNTLPPSIMVRDIR